MNGEVQKVLFYAKARKYSTALETALDGPNIPMSVYTRLVDGVNRNLPAFHRYLKLRKRMMGLERAALLRSLRAARRVGEPEVHAGGSAEARPGRRRAARRRLPGHASSARSNERWIDLFPSEGKRSGAYSNGGAYDVHPYMLINYNGKYNDVSTLAHELGHTMQSYFSNKTQPYPLADYPIFVAEVASTFNESLLIDYMLQEHQGRRRAAVAARQLPREHQGHGVPADAVRRVRAADARDGAEGPADHRRRAGEAVHGHHEAVLRPRPGRLHRRRLHRARVELHPALLPRLLRLPVRDLVHRVRGARAEGEGRRRRGDAEVSGVSRRRAARSTRSIC